VQKNKNQTILGWFLFLEKNGKLELVGKMISPFLKGDGGGFKSLPTSL